MNRSRSKGTLIESPSAREVKGYYSNQHLQNIFINQIIIHRIFGDERPPPSSHQQTASDVIDLTDGLQMKAPRQPPAGGPARKTRPPPKFDLAAELLMSGGRERELPSNPVKLKINNNNHAGGMGGAGAGDDQDDASARLLQRLKAL